MARNAPLLASPKATLPQLYDPAALLEMEGEVARGYLTLMGGTVDKSKNGKLVVPDRSASASTSLLRDGNSNDVTVGFLALTEGNTVDACLGVNPMLAQQNQQGKKRVQQVKVLLADAVDANEDIRRLAVLTYQGAFHIVYAFDQKRRKLNCITHCFCYGKLRKKALKVLQENFQQLEEAIQQATSS